MLSRDRRLPDWLRFRLWADAGSKDAALKRAKPGRWRRWHVRSLAALSLTAVLLAAFAVLLALPLPAQAQALTTFVSNTNISSPGVAGLFMAQSFVTGANAGGYKISEVQIKLSDDNDPGALTNAKIRDKQ